MNEKKKKRVVRSVWDRKGYRDPEPSFVDEKTGEVILGWGPDKVDSSGYEPMEKIVNRMIRGELIPGAGVEYEFGPGIDPALALDMMNPILTRGVDRVDAINFIKASRELLEQMMRNQKKGKLPVVDKKPEGGDKPPEAPPPAEVGR